MALAVAELDSKTTGSTTELRRLLVVDDQKGITKIVRAIAGDLGYEVMEINDAALAAEAFAAFKPDTLVLDIIMPETDGLDVLNEVLVIDPSVKVVLISGYGDTFLRLGRSVSDFHGNSTARVLRKPFRADELRALLMEI